MRAVLPMLLCLATLLLPGSSQETAADNKDQAYIIESAETLAEFQSDGNYTRHEKLTILIQADAGLQQWGTIRFTYPAEHNTMEVVAVAVTKPDGSIVKTDVSNLQDLPAAITQQMPFYSDVHEKHAVVKGLSVGDRLTYEYTTRSTKPLIPGEFWFDYSFNDIVITKKESVVVVVPASRPIKLRSVGRDPAIEHGGDKTTYRWTHSNLKLNPNAKDEGPDPKDVLSRSAPPDIQLSSFASWEQIGKWYAGLQAPMVQASPEIAAKAKQLTADKSDEAEKVKAIAAYVGTGIRYVGIEFGIGRYQPHAATEVLANAYGDCKDKHTLLAAMLQAIGIKAEPALISSKLEIDRSVPTVSVFDHVITAVEIAGKREFVDTTGEVYPYGYLPQALREKDALLAAATPALVRTPMDSPIANAETYEIDGTLSPEGVLTGKVKRDIQGDSEIIVRSIFRKVPPAQWKQVVQGISAYSGFGGTVDNVKITTPEDLGTRFSVSYDYERKDFARFKDGLTSPALPSMMMMNPADLDKRKKPIVMTTGKMEATSKIKMPPGAMLRAPGAKDLVEAFAEYHATYSFDSRVLYATRSLIVKQKMVEPAQFDKFRDFLKAVQDDRDKEIVLNLLEGELKRVDPNKEAIELFNKSKDSFRLRDFISAIKSLKKLVETDPDYPNAWGMLGSAYFMAGQKDLGVEALRQQIVHNPKESLGYKVLGDYYAGTNQVPQAIEVWNGYLKINPNDNEARLTVARLHARAKQYADASAIYAELLKAKPDDPALMLEQAGVQLANGETERAFATFDDVLKLHPTASQKNNVAYMLIENKAHLADAMKWAEEAVREVEGKSSRIDLAEVTMEDNSTTVTLAMYWDTLGWGYFQTGDYTQASKYLQAASSILEDPVIWEHYAEALEKSSGRKAAETYALAATLGSGPSSSKAMSRLRVLAPGRAELLKKQAIPMGSMMRTFKVSGTAGVKSVSSSDVLLLIGNDGKIADVKWLQDSALAKADTQLRALDLHMRFPSERPAKVLRRGIYMCSSITGCNLTLLTPSSVRSVN